MTLSLKLLAEWFWMERWDGSSAALLPMEAQGIYRAMLSHAWRRGARLPTDLEEIRLIIRCREEEWNRSWPKVQKYWRNDGDSLVNDTQLEVYSEAMERAIRAKARSESAAQASAQARAQARAQAEREGIVKRKLKQSPPSPSPSPSPIPINGPTTTRAGKKIATIETQAALQQAVTELSELTGVDYVRTLERATSGHLRTGKKRCEPCLQLARISQDQADRSLLDVNTALALEKSK